MNTDEHGYAKQTHLYISLHRWFSSLCLSFRSPVRTLSPKVLVNFFLSTFLAIAGAACQSPQTFEPVPAVQLIDIDPAPASLPTSLTVGTYNVHWLSDPKGLREALAKLSFVNVWCLQEVRVGDDAASARSAFARILPPGRWHVAITRVNRLTEIGSADWECQAVVSRFAMSNTRTISLDDTGSKRRIALAVEITPNGEPVCIVNTDHEPSFFAWHDRNKRQFEALAAATRGVPVPRVVVAGDFNCSGNLWRLYTNPMHVRRLDAAFAVGSFLPAVANPTATFHAWPLSLRLDRIYIRNLMPTSQGVESTLNASDHFPVWTTLSTKSP